MVFKVKAGDSFRRFSLKTGEVSFSALLLHTESLLNVEPNRIGISYTDEDGDDVVIGSDLELQEIIRNAASESTKRPLIVKLFTHPISPSDSRSISEASIGSGVVSGPPSLVSDTSEVSLNGLPTAWPQEVVAVEEVPEGHVSPTAEEEEKMLAALVLDGAEEAPVSSDSAAATEQTKDEAQEGFGDAAAPSTSPDTQTPPAPFEAYPEEAGELSTAEPSAGEPSTGEPSNAEGQQDKPVEDPEAGAHMVKIAESVARILNMPYSTVREAILRVQPHEIEAHLGGAHRGGSFPHALFPGLFSCAFDVGNLFGGQHSHPGVVPAPGYSPSDYFHGRGKNCRRGNGGHHHSKAPADEAARGGCAGWGRRGHKAQKQGWYQGFLGANARVAASEPWGCTQPPAHGWYKPTRWGAHGPHFRPQHHHQQEDPVPFEQAPVAPQDVQPQPQNPEPEVVPEAFPAASGDEQEVVSEEQSVVNSFVHRGYSPQWARAAFRVAGGAGDGEVEVLLNKFDLSTLGNHVESLVEMGFSAEVSREALLRSDGSLSTVLDRLLG